MCERSFCICAPKNAGAATLHPRQLVKNLMAFRRCSGEKSQIIFSGDMCGGENTARPANVRAVRPRRTARALQSGRKPFCQKRKLF